MFCDKDSNCGVAPTEQYKNSTFGKDKIQVETHRLGKNFYLLVDTNQNAKLSDEKKVLLKNGSSVLVKVRNVSGRGKSSFLVYEISHSLEESRGRIVDSFSITPHYAAVGELRYRGCSTKIMFSDMNFDGQIDLVDAAQGTNLRMDRNNDGKFWGKGEFLKSNEIIEFCGQSFLISSLNRTIAIFTPTELRIARLDRVVPPFSFTLLNGEQINSATLKGKNYVLDFWASWCVPCVENLPEINELRKGYENRLSVFSVNVNDAKRKSAAEKIISENKLFDFSTIRGAGEDDFLWKTFGSSDLNHLSIPLYVFVDKKGILRYAGKGGDELSDLRKAINKSLSEIENEHQL